ncbi:putative bifunctional diguanylate cyclase/phosphodiesterase [Undibacterium fentianense]|uniref:EAL domain-containing protein n=1 Tax=Undibacterium fentianense TaxID=2828728 RepID=A0A941IE07_9BURK|nr:EAL domain-containing protein [Undibacterium fentianense]MBR7798917.1 EAL domain-containing protein [Undibacterium fentianense]
MRSSTGLLQDLRIGAELCEAIMCFADDELESALNRLAKQIFDEANLEFRRTLPISTDDSVCRQIVAENYFVLSGKHGHISESDLDKLNYLTALTAQLFSSKLVLHTKFDAAIRAQSLHSQILDQIHESVITMDLAGFILSWNLGAEKLFGYSANEAVGQNILFLYENEEVDDDSNRDIFLEQGGREMEVRRRKKNGEIFWASLSLSTLNDEKNIPIGMIGYLTDITERKRSEEKINHLAYYDPLTDLPNRTLFKKLIDNVLQQSQRNEVSMSVMFIDLNRFKPINDTLGHNVGDQLLIQVAQRFRSALRENDVIARLGSDEFAVALHDVKQHFHTGLVAQKMLATLEQVFQIENHELRLGASIGISIYPQDGEDAEALLQKADIAMFKAKRQSEKASGSYAFYDVEMNRLIAGRLYLESGIRRALQNDEFFLLYQPKVDIHSGAVIGAEALIRWAHPKDGIISPIEFIGVAEETNLILQIDAWVLDAACAQAKRWQDEGVLAFPIAVNVSAKEFTSSLPERIEHALRKHQISPAWLELEITESMLMQNADGVVRIMNEITAQGVKLALDDFGTGFSSLSYLKKFPIDTLKIDRSFIQGIPDDVDDCAIASAIISMAKQMKHRVIAEGVENREQFSFLQKMGCDEIQGYLFSRPLDVDAFAQLIAKKLSLPTHIS